MKRYIGFGIVVGFAMALGACGGGGSPTPSVDSQPGSGSEVSASGQREVSGRLATTDGTSPTTTSGATTACALADGLTVTNSADATVNYIVAADCSFNFTVNVHEVHHVHFTREAKPVAELAVGPDSFGEGSVNFIVGDGDGTVQLGTVIVANGNATVNVKQDDTIIIAKPDTLDCDLDGLPDDLDEDEATCLTQPDPKEPRFFAVLPPNDPNAEGKNRVKVDTAIRASANCAIDTTTLTADAFKITTRDGTSTLACILTIKASTSGSMSQIQCAHDLMLANTAYVATIDGVKCAGDVSLPKTTWQWTTQQNAAVIVDNE